MPIAPFSNGVVRGAAVLVAPFALRLFSHITGFPF
jgi:hypothetical protein